MWLRLARPPRSLTGLRGATAPRYVPDVVGGSSPIEVVAGDAGASSGARHAIACIGHELAGPITALYTHLKLVQRKAPEAAGDSLDAALRCVERLRDIASALRDTAATNDAPPLPAFGVLLARAAVGMEISATIRGEPEHTPARLALVLREALRAVARTAPSSRLVVEVDPQRIRIAGDAVPAGATWRTLSPLTDSHLALDLWLAAFGLHELGGAMRIAEPGGGIAVELELPSP